MTDLDATAELPADVVFQAKNPSAAGPEPHPDSKAIRVLTDDYCILVTSMAGLTFVERVRTTPDRAAATVEEVRGVMRAHGRTKAAWCMDSVEQADVVSELRRLGMTDYDDPPMEPTCAAMALVVPPAGEPGAGVELRRCVELDDYVAAGQLAVEVFGLTGDDAEGMLAMMRRRHVMEHDGRSHMRQYVALIDGEVVGEAQASLLDAGSNLSGASVRESARGRGLYRALIQARWDDAVARGRPALTVQAGSMSRPILERLGFVTVAEMEVLRDSFA